MNELLKIRCRICSKYYFGKIKRGLPSCEDKLCKLCKKSVSNFDVNKNIQKPFNDKEFPQ